MADAPDTPVGSTGASPNMSDDSPTSLPASLIDKRRKTSISSLPVEILVIIFGEVYRSCTFGRFKPEWSPLTLGSVCPSWTVAMHLTPEFFTRLNILLDGPHFSAAFVASILVRSRDLIVENVTCTRNIWTAMHDQNERARVMTVMQAIAPHMHRCRRIFFNVRFSSSLPSILKDFHGSAKVLQALGLTCLEDDGGAISTIGGPNSTPVDREQFRCPNLRELVIDGRNYFNACRQNVNWTEMFPFFSALSISRFTPGGSESFTASEFKLSLVPFRNHLVSFGIDNVHLDVSPGPGLVNNGQPRFDRLKRIMLSNMHDTLCLRQILYFLGGPSDLHITRCRLDPRYDRGRDISLKDIDISEDLVAFLKSSHARRLVIDGCPGFGDTVLNAMIAPTTDRFLYCAPYVQDLLIINCPNISILTLKKLVETRRIWRDSGNHIFGTAPPPCIRVLLLSGRVPEVSPEDKDWFAGCLSKFSYHPTP